MCFTIFWEAPENRRMVERWEQRKLSVVRLRPSGLQLCLAGWGSAC